MKGPIHGPRRHVDVNDDCRCGAIINWRCHAIIISDGIGGCRTCGSDSIAGDIFHAAQFQADDFLSWRKAFGVSVFTNSPICVSHACEREKAAEGIIRDV